MVISFYKNIDSHLLAYEPFLEKELNVSSNVFVPPEGSTYYLSESGEQTDYYVRGVETFSAVVNGQLVTSEIKVYLVPTNEHYQYEDKLKEKNKKFWKR
tara:strand:+ start:1890 stop:2186 length:297 start_codon:yes stop_codon:yes gene_type:complete